MRLLIAAGGTGGHLFPGIAVAQVFREINPGGEVLFVGTERGLEKEILERANLKHETLNVGRIKGEGFMTRVKTLLTLPMAILQARRLLKRFKPDVVFGIGGYSSGPVIVSAFLKKIPRAILEPNAIPGFTNRLLAWFVSRIFIAFPEARRFFPKEKVRCTGTPVREELTEIGRRRNEKIAQKPFTIVVIGGSQGATSINDAMVGLLPDLEKSGKRFRILHQTGARDESRIQEAYSQKSIPNQVSAFINDMGSVFREADLAICRAGASTIAELIATRTPSILIPYPFAADDHQRFNAQSVVQVGGAEMILNKDICRGEVPSPLFDRILFLESHREDLQKMSDALKKLQTVPAAEVVVRECLAMTFA